MRWTPGNRSNIEDHRGRSALGVGGASLGIGGVLVLVALSWFTGIDLTSMLGDGTSGPPPASYRDAGGPAPPVATTPAEEREVDFVDAVMKDVQETWQKTLPNDYQTTKAVLFRNAVDSACGFAQSATGPFYCPQDRRVYLDLGFFDELRDKFGAPGEFARAYVLAHEIGHHVQRLTGIEERVRAAQQRQPSAANAMSVRLELQADCFAGVWGHTAAQPNRAARGQVELEAGDIEQGMQAAAAIGDDRLQRMSTGHVMPDRFTHGSSAQRVEWFRRGLATGRPDSCDTFGQ